MADELDSDAIAEKALEPAEISGEMGSVKQRPISELIAAEKHQAAQALTGSAWGGAVRPARMVTPGTQGPRVVSE